MSKGIDYGLGVTNIDKATGIRYGVISSHEVLQAWCDSSEADYGPPTCGACGNEAQEVKHGFDYSAECGVFLCNNEECEQFNSPLYPMELDEGGVCPECGLAVEQHEFDTAAAAEYVCYDCCRTFASEDAYGDEAIATVLDDGEYTATQDSDGDIFVIKSPYYTRAQFCSPCAPGACHLANPLDDGEKCYCFGHDWFEDEVAPYPVYSVATNEIVPPPEKTS